jgi:flap endonuclease-1
MPQNTLKLVALRNVPVMGAPAGDGAKAAYVTRRGAVEYIGSEDYDTLLLGAPYTLRQLTSKGDPECMDFEATLEKHDLTWEGLVDAAILMGTDFNEGIPGVGPKTAVKLVREHGDLWSALEARGDAIPHADRIRTLFLDPVVTDDYEYDTDIDPDIDAAKRYVTDEWGIPADEVERGFERIEESVVQTGLDRWS